MMMQTRRFLLWAFALILCGAFVSVAEAGIVDGLVVNDSGRSGRVYLSLRSSSGGETGLGTSVLPSGTTPTYFIITGVADGSYSLSAYLDTGGSGLRHANDPGVSVEGVVVSGGSASAGSLSLRPPAGTAFPAGPLAAPAMIPAQGGVAVMANNLPSVNGYPVAEGLNLSCGSAGSVSGMPGVNGSTAYLPLPEGTAVSCTLTPVIAGVVQPAYASPASAPVQSGDTCRTLATCDTGVSVSGTVTFSGALPTSSTPLFISLTNVNSPSQLPYLAIITNPGNPAPFSLTGVVPGTYAIRAVLDHNGGSGDRILGRGDLFADEWRVGKVVVDGSGSVVVPEITLAARNAFVNLGVSHTLNGGADYALSVHVRDGLKLPVALTLENGTGSQLPEAKVTPGRSPGGEFDYSTPAFSTRPTPGETYGATVAYDDGSQESLTLKIFTVLDDFPTPTFMAPSVSSGDPAGAVLAWQTPLQLPAYPYSYTTRLSPGDPGSVSGPLPATFLSRLLSLGALPAPGTPYTWAVSLRDAFGNTATSNGLYAAQGAGPTIAGIAPQSAPAGATVTITGTGLSQATAVSFNGREGTIGATSDTSITATVPPNASSGPILVTAGGTTASSAFPFTPTIALGGTVRSVSGAAVAAISVGMVGNPAASAGTDMNGVYTMAATSGIPAGVPFVVKVSDPNRVQSTYHDAYSPFVSSTADLAGRNFTLLSDADLANGGFSGVKDNAKGMVRSHVVDASGGGVAGVTVAVASWKHPDSAAPYTVRYDDGSGNPSPGATSTPDNGRFYVLDIDEGDIVTVTAAKNGWAFVPQGFPVSAGAVSQGEVSGAPMPTVGIFPAPGSYASPQRVTLTTSSPATVYYTTNGADPVFYGTPYAGAISVTTDTTIRYAVRNAAGVTGGAGAADYRIATRRRLTASQTAATATITSITPNTSTYGQPVTIAATVTPVGASGKMQFSNGQGWQESVDVSTITGTAVRTTTAVPAGVNTITAQYLGDANYAPSPVSAGVTLIVNKATTTTGITSVTPNPSTYGQTVTVTAAVAPVGASGKVQFSDGQGWQESVDVSTITGTTAATVNFTAGTRTMTAQYLGDANYAQSAVSGGVALVVNRAGQTISFPPLATKTYGDPPFVLAATATSGLAVSYASSNPAVATVSGTTVTIVGAGTATITATQEGDGNYTAATAVTQTLTVNRAAATVTLGNLATTYTGTPQAATATTVPAGLAVTITYNGSSTAPTAVGSYAVVATVSDANYQGSASGTLTMAKAAQTITLAALPAKTYGDPSFILTGTASSGLAVSYGSSNPAVATVSGTTVTLTGAGTTTITATQAGDGNYNAAPSVGQTLVVNKATLNVVAADASRVYGTANPAFSATYGGFVNGDTQAVVSGTPSLATVATAASPAGTYPIVPAAGTLGTANYTFAFVNGALTVLKANQTITFGSLATQTFTDPPLTLSATATSGLVVSYASSNQAVATMTGNVVTIVGAGTSTITASQVGDGNFNPAASVSQTLTVNKATATVSLGNLSATYDGTPKAATATTTPPGLAVILTYNGSTTPPTKKGSYTVVGTVNDPNYQGSATGTLTISRGTQKITFDPLPGKTYGDLPFQLAATSSSGLPVSYTSSNPAVATVSGTTVTIVGAGSTTITASQSGDNNYNAAQSVSQTLTVARATLTVTANDASRTYGAANPAFSATYSGFVNGDTQAVVSGTPSLTTSATAASPAGSATITAALGTLSAANYAFAFTSGTLTITKAILTCTPANASRPYGAADPSFTATYGGFVNGDTQAAVTGFPAFSTTATASSPVGSYPLTATAGTLGAANYGFAFAAATLSVTMASQSISFPALPAMTYGAPPLSLTATATSGLVVSYTSSNPAVATVSGTTVTIVGAGTTTITASQGGNTNYTPAASVSQTLTVNPLTQGIKLSDNGVVSYYSTITQAYNGIASGTNTTIVLASGVETETVVFDMNYLVTIAGGYDQTFSSVNGVTTLIGSVTFTNGTVNIDGSLCIAGN
jgi:uncharacterized protein (DUF2141 family)